MAKNQPVYRPTLTEDQLKYIVGAAKAEIGAGKLNELNLSVVSVLSPFIAKIENRAVASAYTRNAETVEESLGMITPTNDTTAQKRLKLGVSYVNGTRSIESMSIVELEMLREYRYENDLMSAEEEAAYEAQLMGL